jgi:predicted ATP-dependent serine protease
VRALASALTEVGEAGEPIPSVFHELMVEGAEIRMGELTLIASAPGVGKSLIAVTLAVKAGVPTLFFSADTTPFTTGVRIGAMLTGRTIAEVDHALRDETQKEEYIKLVSQKTGHIRWQFIPCPTVKDIEQDVAAFAVAWGDYPNLIIVDNLRNVYSDEDDYTGFRHNIEALKILAVETGSAVVVLHHLTGSYDDGQSIPPLSALEGKVSKLPSMVLNLFNGNRGDIGVAVVKNRFGAANPAGKLYVFLDTDLERVQIR